MPRPSSPSTVAPPAAHVQQPRTNVLKTKNWLVPLTTGMTHRCQSRRRHLKQNWYRCRSRNLQCRTNSPPDAALPDEGSCTGSAPRPKGCRGPSLVKSDARWRAGNSEQAKHHHGGTWQRNCSKASIDGGLAARCSAATSNWRPQNKQGSVLPAHLPSNQAGKTRLNL